MLRGLDDPPRALVDVLLDRDARHRRLIAQIGAALDAGDYQLARSLVRQFQQETGQCDTPTAS